MRDHTPLVVSSFRGTFDRGEDDVCPVGHNRSSQNLRFTNGGTGTRYGTELSITKAAIKRVAVYKRIGEAQRLLILNSSGQLFDSTDLSTPILTIAAMSDFSMVSIFNRAYITPHNGVTGLPGEKVYVYEGSGTANPAAGTGPSTTLVATETANSGYVETGDHAYAVSFETESGFITPPSGFTILESTGGFTVNVASIEVGGSRVVARHVLATKRIVDFNGNFEEQTYYFASRIDNNTDTSVEVNFFDADLVEDATYLLEEITEIPAGVGISSYRGRMIVWGEDAASAVCRVSEAGEPESFNAVEGFLTVDPGVGGGLKNCWEYRSQLFLQKSLHTYGTMENGNPAAFWEVTAIDMSVGTECHGVAKSLDFGSNIQDIVLVATHSGVRLFSGNFGANDITFNIDDIWGRITPTAFNKIEITVDPVEFLIYIAVPLDGATSPTHVLFGDYSEGITADLLRWSTWAFPYAPTSIVVDVVADETVFKFASVSGNVYQMDSALLLDDNQAIDSWVEFPLLPISKKEEDDVNHFTGIKLRIKGSGLLAVTLSGLDGVDTLTALTPALSTTPGKPVFVGFNFVQEKCSVKLRLNTANSYFHLTKYILYYTSLWKERANL